MEEIKYQSILHIIDVATKNDIKVSVIFQSNELDEFIDLLTIERNNLNKERGLYISEEKDDNVELYSFVKLKNGVTLVDKDFNIVIKPQPNKFVFIDIFEKASYTNSKISNKFIHLKHESRDEMYITHLNNIQPYV